MGVFSIPTSLVRHNVATSAKQIENDGLWFQPLGFYLFQVDNMTDCLMMNIAATADSDNPVVSAMNANVGRYDYDELRSNYLNMPQMTYDVATYGREHMDFELEYARYWHGYQVFLRPLLTVLSYHSILVLNICLMLILLAATLTLAYRHFRRKEFLSFALSLAIFFVPCVPLAIQFSICFYIALQGMCFLFLNSRVAASIERSCILFFVLGGMTSFFDFLTTPQITLGLPLITLMLLRPEHRSVKKIFALSVLWAAGYALVWSGKWVLGSLITHDNIIEGAMGAAQMRVSDCIVFGGEEMPMIVFFSKIWQMLCTPFGTIPICMGLIALAIIYLCVRMYSHRAVLQSHAWLLVVALIVPVWYIVLKNHTLQHVFFTWRAFIVTFWSLLLFSVHSRNRAGSLQ